MIQKIWNTKNGENIYTPFSSKRFKIIKSADHNKVKAQVQDSICRYIHNLRRISTIRYSPSLFRVTIAPNRIVFDRKLAFYIMYPNKNQLCMYRGSERDLKHFQNQMKENEKRLLSADFCMLLCACQSVYLFLTVFKISTIFFHNSN